LLQTKPKAMSKHKSMVFKLDPEQREAEGQLVERYLTALGYESDEKWNDWRRHDSTREYIFVDDVIFMYMNDNCEAETFEPIPTPYQVVVAEHMATAPQELAEYVRGRLPEGELTSSNNPFGYFYIAWQYTSEGYDFWRSVNEKDWESAMATDFWKKHTAPSEAPSERPKGVIGQWYTMTSNFCGNFIREDREAGYTWQCNEIDGHGEPVIDGIGIGYKESYRLATPEEIAAAQVPTIEFEKPEHSEEYDYINPSHYQEFSVEVIDMMAAIWGKEATATHCEMCAFKYKLRAGSKPDQPIERDLDKAAWYLSKAKELRDA